MCILAVVFTLVTIQFIWVLGFVPLYIKRFLQVFIYRIAKKCSPMVNETTLHLPYSEKMTANGK